MIEVKNVTKTYGKKQNAFQALKDVSFTIPDGASVAILGKSGSGKSTLMHAMSGLDRPERGQVIIDGEDILTLKQKAVDRFRAEKIGFIFQSFFVQGNESVYDNVSLPLEIAGMSVAKRKARVKAALEAVDLVDKIKNKAKNLSGGQKQRLAVARAIANEPRIIFAGEPTGNLDAQLAADIMHLFAEFNHLGTSVLIASHDMGLIQASGCRILTLQEGRLVGDMTPGGSHEA